ncbi:uncharacterized protein K452DRAFT_302584 [Aplosporella prunicola CBS 121167]|uniref:Uncharacterized protein n=1 Tax=Aplosporella prunicola CBS 121167 TaxID=1176127 RepID=A0A6A6AXH5_9PEZI|nr:uncharacterized protein K452DRAFT_302584 [Aplosporella prunicola CBS 121167]KAF2136639.1 hypothetical protein K452DRAFT_302584 [Aplosporella prunicola CBS 121167]
MDPDIIEELDKIKDWAPQKCPGTDLLCGIWASAGVIAHAEQPSLKNHKLLKYNQFVAFTSLRDLFGGSAYRDAVENLGLSGDEKSELLSIEFLSDDQIILLIELYRQKVEQLPKDFRVGIRHYLEPESAHPFSYLAKSEPQRAPIYWFMNRWGVHWEPITPVLNSVDISEDGRALDLDEEDPCKTGAEPIISYDPLPNLVGIDAVTMGKITEETRLMALNIPDSKDKSAWSATRDIHHHKCQIISGHDPKGPVPTCPAGSTRDNKSINLSIAFGSLELNLYIQLKIMTYRTIPSAEATLLHSGTVRFPFGRLYRQKDGSIEARDNNTGKYETIRGCLGVSIGPLQDNKSITVKFTANFGAMDHLNVSPSIRSEMFEKELQLISFLPRLTRPRCPIDVTLRVFLTEKERGTLNMGRVPDFITLLKYINDFPAMHEPPYKPYLRESGFPETSANLMKPIFHRLNHGSPHMPVKVFNQFLDPIEAEVHLAFDVDTEHVEQ